MSTQILTLLQVLLARHKETTKYYAVKVLQKKIIIKKKEVSARGAPSSPPVPEDVRVILNRKRLLQQKHIMAERSVLMKNIKHPFLVGLHYSFQTTDKLYFVLDYVNGGEVRSRLSPAEIPALFVAEALAFPPPSSSTISRGRGSSWSPGPGSTLRKSPVPSATSTPSTSCTGEDWSRGAASWTVPGRTHSDGHVVNQGPEA